MLSCKQCFILFQVLAFDVGGLGFEFCVFVAGGGVSGLLLLLLLLYVWSANVFNIININMIVFVVSKFIELPTGYIHQGCGVGWGL